MHSAPHSMALYTTPVYAAADGSLISGLAATHPSLPLPQYHHPASINAPALPTVVFPTTGNAPPPPPLYAHAAPYPIYPSSPSFSTDPTATVTSSGAIPLAYVHQPLTQCPAQYVLTQYDLHSSPSLQQPVIAAPAPTLQYAPPLDPYSPLTVSVAQAVPRYPASLPQQPSMGNFHAYAQDPPFSILTSLVNPTTPSSGQSSCSTPTAMQSTSTVASLVLVNDAPATAVIHQAPAQLKPTQLQQHPVRFSPSKQKKSTKPIAVPPPAAGQAESTHLVVQYLSGEISDVDFRQLFQAFEGLVHSRVVTEQSTGRSRGFGYLWFATQAAALKAIDEASGRVLLNKRIRIVFADPQAMPW